MRLRDGEICIFTNRRLQLVALAIEFALSNTRQKQQWAENQKKGKNYTKTTEQIQFHFFCFGLVSFGFGLNKRLAINCVLIFVSHFEMGSQPFLVGRHCK